MQSQPGRLNKDDVDDSGSVTRKRLSTYTSEEDLKEDLVYDKKELWKLQTQEEGSEIRIKYPTEMELSPIRQSINHFGIKPAQNMRHETFLQMLRCLPWTKLY
ncbi:uncharacterized protein LOC141890290 [Acropora palmata]|uniref:uncharacterized protein LOC141890290 n=1 Tax=Acropora palmata TaxID=6131 RepID=UPI003D9FC1C0